MHAIGIDIGGTKIAGAVVDEFGAIVRSERVPTPAGDPRLLEDAVVAMIESLSDGDSVAAVGVAAAGFIDAAQSTVYYAPNIHWRNEPFREKLEARVGGTVVVDNDANAAGWAEFRFGAGRLVSDMVMPGRLSGHMVLEEAARRWPKVGTVLMSGYTENAVIQAGRLPDHVRLLIKPFTKLGLARALRQAIDT